MNSGRFLNGGDNKLLYPEVIHGGANSARVLPGGPTPVIAHTSYLFDYWRMILKHKWTILAATVIVVTTVTVMSFRMTPLYQAAGRLAIYRESSENLGFSNKNGVGPDESGGEDWDSSIDLDTQVRVLQSDILAMLVINSLHLDQNPAFMPPANKAKPMNETVREAAMLSRFHGAMKVGVLPRTRVVEIRFVSPDPKLAAQVVNELANEYIDQNFKTKFEATMRTSDWLSKQLADLQIKVETSQEKLVRYQKENGIVGLDEKQNIVTSKLDELNKQLTAAEGERIQKEAIYRMALSAGAQSISRDPASLVDKLRAQQADLQSQIAGLTTQFGPSYPKVVELNRQLAQVTANIEKESGQITQRLKSDYLAASQREKMLQSALDEQKQEANKLNESAIDFNILKRDVDTNRQLYEGLLQRLKEAGVSAGLKSSNVRIIDVARIPTSPSQPNIPRNIILGLLIGLTGGVMLAFVLETLDNTVRTPEQVEAISGLPALGIIPSNHPRDSRYPSRKLALTAGNAQERSKVELVAHVRPKSDMAESYRALRTSLLLSSIGRPPKVVLVTSSLPQEGKTTTSINTAIVLAQGGPRVLLVDADLRRPGVHKGFGLRGNAGLSTCLTGTDKPEAVIQPSSIMPNLFVLPAGPLPPHPAELLGSQQMKEYINKWRTEYDHIVIDTPPVLSVTDPVVLSVEADSVVLVIRSGRTTKHALRRSREMLAQVNAPVMGVVVNAVDIHAAEAYYYYYYGSKSGGKYYETPPALESKQG